MKIYFNMSDYENHKFTHPVHETKVVLDFKKLWFASTSRGICSDIRVGTLIDENNGQEYTDEYYTVVFCNRTFLRIKLNDLRNSYCIPKHYHDGRIPKIKFDKL